MSYHPPTVDELNRLLKRRTDVKACASSLLMERRAQGVEELSGPDSIKFRSMTADIEALNAEIEDYRGELTRSEIPPKYANFGRGTRAHREPRRVHVRLRAAPQRAQQAHPW